MVANIIFTKELFIETINELKKQHKHDKKCSKAFSVILPDDHISFYDNHWVHNQLVKILKTAMNDSQKDGWIDYFLWELDFGNEWEEGKISVGDKDFKLKTAEDLWNLLNIED